VAIAISVKGVSIQDLDLIPQCPLASLSKLGSDDKVELDVEANSGLALPRHTEQLTNQCEISGFLLDCEGQSAGAKDLYQNTPLYYLASYREVVMDAPELLSNRIRGRKHGWRLKNR
jgi:hypothetical protein